MTAPNDRTADDRTATGQVVLSGDRLSKSYGNVHAVVDVSFELRRGEVLAMAGHNGAGKSTLIGMLAGARRPSSGTLTIDGRQRSFENVAESRAAGIGVVYQEPMLVPQLSVLANVFLGLERTTTTGRIDRRDLRRRYEQLTEATGISLPADVPVGGLSIGQRQLVQILRAVAAGAHIIILDEPSAALSPFDRERLFALIARMSSDEQPKSFILVSHFLDELEKACERAVVLRNGVVAARIEHKPTARQLADIMAGGDRVADGRMRYAGRAAQPLLTVNALRLDGAPPISLAVGAGEIVGVAGLVGSGRTRLLRALASGRQPAGTVRLDGADIGSSRGVRPGLALLPEDRRSALIADWPLWKNVTLPDLKGGPLWAPLDTAEEKRRAAELLVKCRTKAASFDVPVRTLSGGNQQKVAFARLLASGFKVGLLDEPMHGVDIHAKADIAALITSLAESGLGFLIVAAEFEDLLGIATRVLTLHKGRIVGSHDNPPGGGPPVACLLYEAATGKPYAHKGSTDDVVEHA